MARKNILGQVQEVANKSNEKANVIQLKMINTDMLIDYARNNEDLSYTTDLELSMKQNGFTDPLEVTNYGMEDGFYMILSGHRRRVAGNKVGITTFPCIIKSFSNDVDVKNYVLSANAQRNAVADPLLYCKRYKMHEEYLKESGFKGSVIQEIANRLGISYAQADRYNKFNNIILPCWDMVRNEIVGMSSLLPMASHSIEEQEEILIILNECLEMGNRLTRDTCDLIIKEYRQGKKSYSDIIGTDDEDKTSSLDNTVNFVEYVNDKKSEPTNDEEDNPSPDNTLNNPKPVENTNKLNHTPTEAERKILNGDKIRSDLVKLEESLNKHYEFSDDETAKMVLNTMNSMISLLLMEMESISNTYTLEKEFVSKLNSLVKEIKEIKE